MFTRPLLLLALIALLATLVPATAQAQSSTFDAAAACPSATVPSSGFTDTRNVHSPNIDCLAWYGLTQGRTATNYGNLEPVRRDQTASFTVRLLERVDGAVLPTRRQGAFRDVSTGVHLTNIETLAGANPAIVAGFTNGTFRPSLAITRAQFASIAARTLDELASQGLIDRLPNATSTFQDTRGSVHEGNIARLARAGVIFGRDANTFDPNGNITRGQVASMLARILGGLVNEDLVMQPRLFEGVVHDATGVRPGEVSDPIEGATVRARGVTDVSARTNAAGEYRLWLQQPSEYTLTVSAAGFVPQQRQVSLPDAEYDTDLAMYRQASAPAASTPAVFPGTPDDNVEVANDSEWWIVDLPFDAREAVQIRLRFPQNLVVDLGTSPVADLWLSRNPDGTSARVGADSGDHTLYYNMGTVAAPVWQAVVVTFDGEGRLTHVNGAAYTGG